MNPKGVDWEDVQTGNWNVARPYTTEKILKWLVQIDYYQTIAVFGYSNIESDVFIGNKNLQNTSRLHALRRLLHAILSLIRNTKFAIKETDKPSFGTYTERLLKIEKYLNKLREEKRRGQRVVELNINEDLFDKIMGELSSMIDDINYKLNKADLIFAHTEEYDPKKIKEAYKDRFINKT
jgi:hypothetical protein